MVLVENRFAICTTENPKTLDVYSVLQTNLLIFSFFGSPGVPTFQTFISYIEIAYFSCLDFFMGYGSNFYH